MTSQAFEALSARYSTDADFRDRMDAAASGEEAVRIAAESGFDVTASDIAQLGGADAELGADLLDAVSGGGDVSMNFTYN